MSIMIDILQAKDAYDRHVGAHKCSARLLAQARGETPCDDRLELLLAYNGGSASAAGRWGAESTDRARLHELYAWQDKILDARPRVLAA